MEFYGVEFTQIRYGFGAWSIDIGLLFFKGVPRVAFTTLPLPFGYDMTTFGTDVGDFIFFGIAAVFGERGLETLNDWLLYYNLLIQL